MPMFKAAMAVAAVFFGAISTVLGAIVTVSALATGTISIVREAGPSVPLSFSDDPASFVFLLAAVGLAPLLIGAIAVRWVWRRISGKTAE